MRFFPTVEVESLPIFNAVDKTKWSETSCPKCGIRYKIARLSRHSTDVCIILAEPLPRSSDWIEEIAPPVK